MKKDPSKEIEKLTKELLLRNMMALNGGKDVKSY